MSKAKPSPARVLELKRQLAAIEAELGMTGAEDAAPQTSLGTLRQQLRDHRVQMRLTPGGIVALEDERREALLLRAIELAKAPESARMGHADGIERADGATNAGLTRDEDAEEEA